jgi:ribosomal protein L31
MSDDDRYYRPGIVVCTVCDARFGEQSVAARTAVVVHVKRVHPFLFAQMKAAQAAGATS